MSTSSNAERMVLRAELSHNARQIVGHTTELTTRSVFVRTDAQLAIGDAVGVRLSFPRLLAPLELAAHVVAIDPGLGHGYSAGVTLEFDAATAEQGRLAELLYQPAAGEESPAAAVNRLHRILVVEDSALMRDLMQLGAARFAGASVQVIVEATDSAEEALVLLRDRPYQLVLVDLYLPGPMDGAALVRSLRETQVDLPVIGFSVGGEVARTAFLAAGADLFLDKPVVVRDVFSTLERLTLMRARSTA